MTTQEPISAMCSTQQQGESEVTSPRAGQPSTAAAPAPVAPAAPEETAAAAEQQEDCAASHAGVSCSAADTDSLPRRPPGRPARISGCQVCGCSLENTKSRFYKRYHICSAHMMAEALEVGGQMQRFCQQCGRFHPLSAFDLGLRSCRRQLARHAERRRQGRAQAAVKRGASASSSPTSSVNLGNLGGQWAASLEGPKVPQQGLPLPPLPPSQPRPKREPGSAEPAAPPSPPPSPEAAQQAQQAGQPQQQQQQAGQPSGSVQSPGTSGCNSGGLDALLAAAEEEEAAEAKQHARAAAKRAQQQGGRGQAAPQPKRQRVRSTEPDPAWFAAPAAPPALPCSPAPATVASGASSQSWLAAQQQLFPPMGGYPRQPDLLQYLSGPLPPPLQAAADAAAAAALRAGTMPPPPPAALQQAATLASLTATLQLAAAQQQQQWLQQPQVPMSAQEQEATACLQAVAQQILLRLMGGPGL